LFLKKEMNVSFFIIHHWGHFLPRGVGEFITRRIADFCYFTIYRKGRNYFLQNIDTIFGDSLTYKEKRHITLMAVRNFATFVYEFLLVPRINKRNMKKFMIPVNFERARNAFKKGKGVIILTGHIGNYEWGAVLLRLLGYPLVVISLPYKTRYITNFFEQKRKSQGMEILYTGHATIGSVKALKKGSMLAIVGDRIFSEEGIEVEMFGRKTIFPKGPIILGLITGSPIVPAFSIKERDGLYHVYFEDPIELEQGNSIEEGVRKNIDKWVKIVEKYIKKYPEQWYLFEKLW